MEARPAVFNRLPVSGFAACARFDCVYTKRKKPMDIVFPMNDFSAIATQEDILACFRLLLGRYPSEAEWHGHSTLAGTPLHELVGAYVNSLEFRQRGLTVASSRLELVNL